MPRAGVGGAGRRTWQSAVPPARQRQLDHRNLAQVQARLPQEARYVYASRSLTNTIGEPTTSTEVRSDTPPARLYRHHHHPKVHLAAHLPSAVQASANTTGEPAPANGEECSRNRLLPRRPGPSLRREQASLRAPVSDSHQCVNRGARRGKSGSFAPCNAAPLVPSAAAALTVSAVALPLPAAPAAAEGISPTPSTPPPPPRRRRSPRPHHLLRTGKPRGPRIRPKRRLQRPRGRLWQPQRDHRVHLGGLRQRPVSLKLPGRPDHDPRQLRQKIQLPARHRADL